MRVTTDPGTDLNPVAATDARGRVWIAWQGFRNGNLEILAAVQNGDALRARSAWSRSPQAATGTPPSRRRPTARWRSPGTPTTRAITTSGSAACAPTRAFAWTRPLPVAASRNFEARSSLAYDAQSRLWVAYEASTVKWGKDFGAYETTGVALYQDHNIRVKCFQGSQSLTTAGSLDERLPGRDAGGSVLGPRGRRRGPQPRPSRCRTPASPPKRVRNASPHPPRAAAQQLPAHRRRPEGAVYLSFRTPVARAVARGHGLVGERASTTAAKWKGPIFVPRTDGLLDARAAWRPSRPGT